MRNLTSILTIVSSVYWGVSTQAETSIDNINAGKKALALEIIEIQQQKPRYENIARRYLNQLSERPGLTDHAFLSKYQATMQWSAVRDSFVNTLTQAYSEEEMSLIIEFLQSEVGQIYLQKSPLVSRKNAEFIMDRLEGLTKNAKP